MLMFLIILFSSRVLAAETPPELAFLKPADLSRVKRQLQHGHAAAETREAYRLLLVAADRALQQPDLTVTEKGMTPPSGTKHDYLSLSAYWWPDSASSQGLPWVRRDGKINPASKNNQSDGVRLASFTARVQELTLAWYFSGQQRYADKAAQMLRVWFIAPATRMNPNLNYAQGVPGRAVGRNSGVLDGRYFSTRIVDALVLLQGNPAWRQHDAIAMRHWLQAYLHWLQTSPLALKESRARNNHGNWYATQVAGIAWYLRKPDIVEQMVALTQGKLSEQLTPDGAQPLELARTRSFHYSYFNLQAVTLLARLAENQHLDLWHYKTANGSGIVAALDFMAPYTDDTHPWPYKSLDRIGVRLIPLLSSADNALHTSRYRQQIDRASFTLGSTEKAGKDPRRGAIIDAQRETWLLSLPQ